MKTCRGCLHWCVCSIREDDQRCGYFMERKKTVPKPQTNADRIRAMNDEELADEFMRFFAEVLNTNTDGDWSFTDDFRDELLKDLQQPVKDGEDDG